MPLPLHALQTVEMPTVTQIRASNDYQRYKHLKLIFNFVKDSVHPMEHCLFLDGSRGSRNVSFQG